MSCCDQLPFIVSQNPYRTANSGEQPESRRYTLSRSRPVSAAAAVPAFRVAERSQAEQDEQHSDSTGMPHQKPRPTKTATKTGAKAVPNPRSALRTRTALSARSGRNAAT